MCCLSRMQDSTVSQHRGSGKVQIHGLTNAPRPVLPCPCLSQLLLVLRAVRQTLPACERIRRQRTRPQEDPSSRPALLKTLFTIW